MEVRLKAALSCNVTPTLPWAFTNIKGLDTTGNLLQLSGLHDDPTYNISFVNVSFTGSGSTPPFSCMGGVKGTYQQLTPAPPSSCGLVPLREW